MSGRGRRPALVAAALVLVAFVASCGSSDDVAVDQRVVVAGDSIARELSGPIEAAYEAPGAEASFFLLPAVATPSREVDTADLLEQDPDVVVVLMGTWEGVVVDTSQPGWEEQYVDEVLAPFVEQVTASGAELVWLGYPAQPDDAERARHDDLNAVWATLPERFEGVTFVDAGAAVEGPAGEFAPSIDVPGSGDTQVRVADGHLCPAGAELMATEVVNALAGLGLLADDGWKQAAWREDPSGFEEPQECTGAF